MFIERKDMHEIETGIPIPDQKRYGRKSTNAYPFEAMQVGQSFAVPLGASSGRKRTIAAVNAAVMRYAKRNGGTVKFTTRTLYDQQVIRVWRVA